MVEPEPFSPDSGSKEDGDDVYNLYSIPEKRKKIPPIMVTVLANNAPLEETKSVARASKGVYQPGAGPDDEKSNSSLSKTTIQSLRASYLHLRRVLSQEILKV